MPGVVYLNYPLSPLGESSPLAPATTPVELMKAVLHRVAARFTDHALATYEDGRPCLPEMERAAHWSGWGAWFIETTRAGDAVAVRDRLDGEKVLAVAFERRRKLVGFPKNRYLTQAETVAAVREALAYVEKWGRS